MLQPNPYTITLCEPVNTIFYEDINTLIDFIISTTNINSINIDDTESDDIQELYYISYTNKLSSKKFSSMILINKSNNKGEVTLNEETFYFIIE